MTWLRERGLKDEAIYSASIGFNPRDEYLDVPDRRKPAFVARGITIPWVIGDEVWKLNVRRAKGTPKYLCVSGSRNALYNADEVTAGRPIVLVEGEFDAWTIIQNTHDIAWAVATGSTTGARHPKWIARLIACRIVLVAYDSDDAGEQAAKYWTATLPNAIRWRPYWGDANDMQRDGADTRSWIQTGISQNGAGDRTIDTHIENEYGG